MQYNIYCDESCHLEHDESQVMVLGATWCPRDKSKEINKRIREIKKRYDYSDLYELKWKKISPNHYKLYYDVIDYFFDDDDIHFRGVIIPDKRILNHESFNQSHDEWYYKMIFVLLKNILDPSSEYKIFLDYKDIQGGQRIKKLHEVLCNTYYDFSCRIVNEIQLVKSDQVEIIQITDILTGALSYLHRSLNTNDGKLKIIERIRERSHYSLTKNTLYKESKMNILIWQSNGMVLDD